MIKGKKFSQNTEKKFYELPKADLIEILDGKNPQKLVTVAKEIARDELTSGHDKNKKVSTSQIRNIYGTVKKLELEGNSQETIFKLILLKPKLAYAEGRNSKIPGLKVLNKVLSDAIDLVSEKEERFTNFCKFFEAILAYHKFHGGN